MGGNGGDRQLEKRWGSYGGDGQLEEIGEMAGGRWAVRGDRRDGGVMGRWAVRGDRRDGGGVMGRWAVRGDKRDGGDGGDGQLEEIGEMGGG